MCGMPACQQARLRAVQNGTNYTASPSAPQTCDYTLNSLEALKKLVNSGELSVVQSQINMYVTDCHFLRAVVYPLFDIYSIERNL